MNLLRRQSITFRLTLLFATVSTAVLLLLGGLIAQLTAQHFEDLDMDMLGGKLMLIQHALHGVASEHDLAALPDQLDAALVGHHGLAVQVTTPDGRQLYASGHATFPAALLTPGASAAAPPLLWSNAGHSWRGMSAQAGIGLGGTATIAVATDTEHHDHFMTSFQRALWSTVCAAALASGLLGWLAVRRGLAPLKGMRQQASDITASQLDQRLPVHALPVELAEVADTFNQMLERLETSFRRLSDFSSDLAHELRSPVSNLLTQTQVMLAKDRSLESYKDVLASNAEELERLSRIISDMLFLAKADNHLAIPRPEAMDLRDEVARLLEFYDALAEERQITLTLQDARHNKAPVHGDRLMLRRAISNLLSNALRHTPPQGAISLRLGDEAPGTTTLALTNTGQTISPEHLPRLFDRFYRVDPSRQHLADGAGLGLAITRSIVLAHGGRIGVASANGLTTFTLTLPT